MNQNLKQHINNINKGIVPKGWKKTKLGIIPDEWNINLISEIGKVYSGGTPDTTKSEYWNGTYDWCTPTDITALKGSKYLTRTDRKISEMGLKKSSANLLPINSLIVCTRATIGDCAINTIPMSTNQGFKNIVPNSDKSILEYLYYFVVASKQKLKRLGNGSTFLEISKRDFDKIKIPLPPLPEQQKIATILSTWDKAVELKAQLIEQKQEKKKGLMQNLLTGKIRVKGFSEEWKLVKLGNTCDIKKGIQLNKTDLTNDGKYPSYSGGISASGYTNEWNTEKDTVIISEGGNSCGYVNYIKKRFWSGGHCYALLNIKDSIEKIFLYQTLKFSEIQIMRLRVGSGLPNVQKKDITNFKLFIPSIKEQKAIAKILTSSDKEIELLKQELESLKEQKKGLMQLLLTGKVRVEV